MDRLSPIVWHIYVLVAPILWIWWCTIKTVFFCTKLFFDTHLGRKPFFETTNCLIWTKVKNYCIYLLFECSNLFKKKKSSVSQVFLFKWLEFVVPNHEIRKTLKIVLLFQIIKRSIFNLAINCTTIVFYSWDEMFPLFQTKLNLVCVLRSLFFFFQTTECAKSTESSFQMKKI